MSNTVTPWIRRCHRRINPNVWPPRAAELLAQHRASQSWWFCTGELCLIILFLKHPWNPWSWRDFWKEHGGKLGKLYSILCDMVFPQKLYVFKMSLKQCSLHLRSYWDHWSRVASWASHHPGKETRAMPIFVYGDEARYTATYGDKFIALCLGSQYNF